jgi:HD-GYP domain-containing protein (c-di-GMP phosphodiesterase class II)
LSLLANNSLKDPDVQGIVVTLRDVTERKRLESARTVMGAANAALVAAGSERDLLQEICNVVVADESYHMAWIGLVDDTRPLGVRLTTFGAEAARYFADLEHVAASTTDYRGPVMEALDAGELRVIQDIAALPEAAAWKQVALDHGHRSLIVIPMRFGEDDAGVLAIYADHVRAFSDAAVTVLSELAVNLSYGLGALRARAGQDRFRARFEASLEAAVRSIATAVEMRDAYTAGHQRRVADLASAIATELGLDPEMTTGIRLAASIHDIGKLTVPAEILSKPGRLSAAELALVREHSQAGHDIVAGIDFPWPAADMILQHHERIDGSGYPDRLRGEEIILGARIIAVADVVEAVSSHRPYRPGLGLDVALHEVRLGRGTLFDPDAVDACLRLFDDHRFQFA